jgi:hypothetical protein
MERDRVSKDNWARKNPDKCKAKWDINNAIQKGSIVKPDRCDLCNSIGSIQGHHPDYSKTLEVIWVCDPCHKMIHKIARSNARKTER